MDELSRLLEIYQWYDKTLQEVKAAAPAFAGFFGTEKDPRKHPCHQQFYDQVGAWTAKAAAIPLSPSEIARGAEIILDAPDARREKDTYWFACAAQKHVMTLIPLLTAEDAGALLERFRELYPRREYTPVQKELAEALSRAAGEPARERQSPLRKLGSRIAAPFRKS